MAHTDKRIKEKFGYLLKVNTLKLSNIAIIQANKEKKCEKKTIYGQYANHSHNIS